MPDPNAKPTAYPIDRLIQRLVEKADLTNPKARDPGTLAALRAWSRDTSRHMAFAPMADLLNSCGVGVRGLDDEVWTTIPALFAWHQRHTSDSTYNLGVTFRKIVGETPENNDTHFRRILACKSINALIGLLPTYVRRASACDARINYVLLYWDLTRWRKSADDARAVKVRWAKGFFELRTQETALPAS